MIAPYIILSLKNMPKYLMIHQLNLELNQNQLKNTYLKEYTLDYNYSLYDFNQNGTDELFWYALKTDSILRFY